MHLELRSDPNIEGSYSYGTYISVGNIDSEKTK